MQRPFQAVLLIVPALLIIVAAAPRLTEGIALERVFPESALLMTNFSLPKESYVRMDRILAEAPGRDGETQILRAEAALGAGGPTDLVLSMVKDGLSRAPADARGWLLLASLLKDRNPQEAAKAFAMAFKLAPLEYYLILPRTVVGAQLWDHLPSSERGTILSDAHAIAASPARRDDLHVLLDTPAGAALATRALANDPESIRKLNRELAREALHLP